MRRPDYCKFAWFSPSHCLQCSSLNIIWAQLESRQHWAVTVHFAKNFRPVGLTRVPIASGMLFKNFAKFN
jgi:hypothetical protein